jgi:hypothetical protein
MLNTKSLFACTLLIPLLGAAISVQAQTQTQGQAPRSTKDAAEAAKRAKCFEAAQAAAATVSASAGQAASAERNSLGSSAYHECAMKAGIRP